MENKELNNSFFKPLYNLLEEHIKSEDAVQEIYNTVKDICSSHGYNVNVKYKCVGTYTINDNNSNLPTQ